MSTANVTPILSDSARSARARKVRAVSPDVSLLTSAADLLLLVGQTWDFATEPPIRSAVKTALEQVKRWCDENKKIDFSQKVFAAYSVLALTHVALEAKLSYENWVVEPVRGGVDAAADLLRSAIRKPTE